jgi:hypothetical protein
MNYQTLESAFSDPASATPELGISPQTTTSFHGGYDTRGIRLFWRPSRDLSATGFHVYRALASADPPEWSQITQAPVAANRGGYTDAGADYMVEYLYRIRPVNDGGEEGDPTHTIQLTRFEPPPRAPENVMIFRDGNKLKVMWDPSYQPRVKAYAVYRRLEGEPEQQLIIVVDSPTTEFEERVSPGRRYFYSVCTVSRNDRKGKPSSEVSYYVP